MEDNKVTVRIYGQEYTISGERDPETIQEIAAYVEYPNLLPATKPAHWLHWHA